MENINLCFSVPIREGFGEEGEFLIRGTAINATLTDNNHLFLPEELSKAAITMKGIPLLIDHDNRVDSVVGRVRNGVFNDLNQAIEFEALVIDEKCRKKIKQGLINSVSIGASISGIEEGEEGQLITRGIKIKELSLVAVPADDKAVFTISSSANNFQNAIQLAWKQINVKESDVQKYERRSSEQMSEENQSFVEEKKFDKVISDITLQLSNLSEKLDNLKVKEADVDEVKTEEVKEEIKSEEPVKHSENNKAKKIVKEQDSDEEDENNDNEGEEEITEEKNFKILKESGSLYGDALTIVRNKY